MTDPAVKYEISFFIKSFKGNKFDFGVKNKKVKYSQTIAYSELLELYFQETQQRSILNVPIVMKFSDYKLFYFINSRLIRET